MALNPNALKQEWANALPELTDPQIVLQTWATVTANYLKNNTEIIFAWTAFLPPPANTPDPIVIANGGIETLEFNLTLSYADEHIPAITHFKNELIAGLSIGTYNITDIGFSTSPALFSSSPTINNLDLDLSNLEPELEDIQLEFANRIINWVKGQAPTAPCFGSHGPYIGSGIVTTIL